MFGHFHVEFVQEVKQLLVDDIHQLKNYLAVLFTEFVLFPFFQQDLRISQVLLQIYQVGGVETLHLQTLADFFRCFLSSLLGLRQSLQKLYHVLGINVKNVLDELALKSITVLIYILVKVQSQFVDDWHPCLQDIEYLLCIFENTFIPINSLHPLEKIRRVVDIEFQLLSNQIPPDPFEGVSDGRKHLDVPQVAFETGFNFGIHVFYRFHDCIQSTNQKLLGVLLAQLQFGNREQKLGDCFLDLFFAIFYLKFWKTVETQDLKLREKLVGVGVEKGNEELDVLGVVDVLADATEGIGFILLAHMSLEEDWVVLLDPHYDVAQLESVFISEVFDHSGEVFEIGLSEGDNGGSDELCLVIVVGSAAETHVGVLIGEDINALKVFLIEYFWQIPLSFDCIFDIILMKVSAIISKKVMNSFFIDFRHVILKISDQRVIGLCELKLVNLILLHLDKLQLIFSCSFFDAFQDIFQIRCELGVEDKKCRNKFQFRFGVEILEQIVETYLHVFVHKGRFFVEQLYEE